MGRQLLQNSFRHMVPGEPQRINQRAAKCMGKKVANHQNSLSCSFLICKVEVMILYRAIVVVTGNKLLGSLFYTQVYFLLQ